MSVPLFEPAPDPPDVERLPLSARCGALARLLAEFETNATPGRPLDLSLLRRTFEHAAAALELRERFGQ